MRRVLSNKYILALSVFAAVAAFGVFSPSRALAASFTFQTSTAVVHEGQEVDVDILLDPQGETINTIAATVTLPSNLVFGGFDDSDSIVALWVDDPSVSADGKSVSFSGIIPGGFSGLIDPFNPGVKKPGNIMRLIFTGKTPGAGTSTLVGVQAYLNDGQGMQTSVVAGSLNLVVDGLLDWLPTENVPDTTPPLPFTPIITRDILLYNNKYVLIFNTEDKQSGINHYEVKEGNGPWVTAVSPYVLQDQKLSGDIEVKAVDRAGNIRIEIVRVHPMQVSPRLVGLVLSILALLACISLWIHMARQSRRLKLLKHHAALHAKTKS